MGDGVLVGDGVYVGVGVGVRVGMIGVIVGVREGPKGELSFEFKRGSIVAPGGNGVKVGGTLRSGALASIIAAARVGNTEGEAQPVRSRKRKETQATWRIVTGIVRCMRGIIPSPRALCQL